MKRLFFIVFVTTFFVNLVAQTHYQTQVFDDKIKTLQVIRPENPLALPIVELGSDENLCVMFDEMSYDLKNFYFKIVHCNANWTSSDLAEFEFMEGFANGQITDYAMSQNTTTNYVNYRFFVPSDDLRLKISGNYVAIIAEDNDFENPVATACFSVVEPLTSVDARVRGNTDIELNGRYQQLEFSVNRKGVQVTDPFSEIKIAVRQNGRFDTQILELKPKFISGNELTYQNIRELVFEGGNQYRSIDFSSEYTYGAGIDRIIFDKGAFRVVLEENATRKGRGVTQGTDADGKFIVNRQNCSDIFTEADYMWVYFSYYCPEPFLSGSIYLLGDLCYNKFDKTSKMTYNFETKCYEKSLFLKQGGYNYQYVFVPKNGDRGQLEPTEGSYWQTQNEYAIYVYHRAWGERYDRLIAVSVVRS